MLPSPRSPFLFISCQVGAEAALKKELERAHPGLRPSFSRPGFVTFKSSSGELEVGFALDSVFARAYGLSLGRWREGDGAGATAFAELARALRAERGSRLRLHAWERDLHFPGDEPPGYARGHWTDAALASARRSFAAGEWEDHFDPDPRPRDGDLVLDLVAVEEGERWYGCHLHSPARSPAPGGRFEIALPDDAPSRAYVKLEEALLWSKLPLRDGQAAIEIGSAPGGASFALLSRGLKVTGIDPAAMDPRVAKHPGYRHLGKSFVHVLPEELPDPAHWLLLDMNAGPEVSLSAVERIAAMRKETLLGVILTLKLNDWTVADQIPSLLERVRKLGLGKLRATQLASNRQEIVVAGLTRRGQLPSR